MAEFDIVSKYLVQHYPGDFARFALGRDDVEGAEVIDPEQLTVQAQPLDRATCSQATLVVAFKPIVWPACRC